MEQMPNSLDDLKFVLRTISEIKDLSLSVETKTRDLQERYRVLDMYGLLVSGLCDRHMCRLYFIFKVRSGSEFKIM